MATTTSLPHPRGTLSMLWIFVLLNTLFRDVHEIFRPGFLAETLAGGGTDETTLLIAGAALQLPLAMVVLSGVLPRRIARSANITIAAVIGIVAAGTWPKDADDILFTISELVGLLAIITLAWKWQDRQDWSGGRSHASSVSTTSGDLPVA